MILNRKWSKHSGQGVFLNPQLDVPWLRLPPWQAIGIDGGTHNVFNTGPLGRDRWHSNAILDCVPVEHSGESGIAHHVGEVLVGTLLIGNDVLRDKLVIELPQGKAEPLVEIIVYDVRTRLDQLQTIWSKILFLKLLFHVFSHSPHMIFLGCDFA